MSTRLRITGDFMTNDLLRLLHVSGPCSLFSEEQYFDANGFFILVVFSGPILLNCFLIVVCQCGLC